MNASELSEQVRTHIDAGEWSQAMTTLAGAWNEASEFGTVYCGLPDYPDTWVRFATHGYPFSLRQKWHDADDDAAVLGLILPRVTAWNLRDVNGADVALPDGDRPGALLDNVDDPVIVWLIRSFFVFWRRDLSGPRKN